MQRARISQRALINRQDGNQERPASRSIGGSPETFRSSFAADGDSSSCDECTPIVYVCVCARYPVAADCVQQQGYPRLMLSSFEIERRSCKDWKAAIPGADRPRCLGVD